MSVAASVVEGVEMITLINIYVFKSANIAVLGVFWHPPDYYLG